MRLAFLLLAVAVSAEAQPRAEAVVEAWRAGWARDAAGVEGVALVERARHRVEGPRGGREVEIDAVVDYPTGQRPERRVQRVRVGGQDVDRQRAHDDGHRLRRTFGRAGRYASWPPPLPDRLLARARASDLRPVQYGPTDAWQVTLETERGPSTAWFTRSADRPRLLAVRTERDEGRVTREIRYARIQGLDLPAESRASVTIRQRRRLREYVVTLDVWATYADPVLR